MVAIHKNLEALPTHSQVNNYNTRNAESLVPTRSSICTTQNNKLNVKKVKIKDMNYKTFNIFLKDFLHSYKECFYLTILNILIYKHKNIQPVLLLFYYCYTVLILSCLLLNRI